MKNLFMKTPLLLVAAIIYLCSAGCSEKVTGYKYESGTFPDSLYNMQDINTVYDDYNSAFPEGLFTGYIPLIFSSNRASLGGQYDIVQAEIFYSFDRTTGDFTIDPNMGSDSFTTGMLAKANTGFNDLGPCRIFNSSDGKEYLITSTETGGDNLDLYYMKYLPSGGSTTPSFPLPVKVKILSSSFNEGYITFDKNKLNIYFTSDREGDWDIFSLPKAASVNLDNWFNIDFTEAISVDSINTVYDDKCPFIYKDIMIFTSNRAGGLGGYDLYYSVYSDGKWGSAVNMGPEINSSADDYRPVMGADDVFGNNFIIFSSNRSGGKGGYDLYFTGFEFP